MMSEPNKVEWTGASGQKYIYWVYAIPVKLNEGQDGNYISQVLKVL
jgi:hypothetical protein